MLVFVLVYDFFVHFLSSFVDLHIFEGGAAPHRYSNKDTEARFDGHKWPHSCATGSLDFVLSVEVQYIAHTCAASSHIFVHVFVNCSSISMRAAVPAC